MKDKRTFKVLIARQLVMGSVVLPSGVADVVDASYRNVLPHPDYYQEATLTLSPKPKTKGKGKGKGKGKDKT